MERCFILLMGLGLGIVAGGIEKTPIVKFETLQGTEFCYARNMCNYYIDSEGYGFCHDYDNI